jgi:hypothetical protein
MIDETITQTGADLYLIAVGIIGSRKLTDELLREVMDILPTIPCDFDPAMLDKVRKQLEAQLQALKREDSNDRPKGGLMIDEIITQTVTKLLGKAPYTGGCRPFYTPAEWRERGEEYGLSSELIVVHDGGDYALFFNYAYGAYSAIDAMDTALREAGYYAESCTSWYTAIYKL